MSNAKSQTNLKSAASDAFSTMNLTAYELASVRARMAQAEAIAEMFVAAYRGVAGAVQQAVNGINAAARRVRSAFMKPAH